MKKLCVTVPFLLCFILYLGANSKYESPGAYIRRGNLTKGSSRYELSGGLYLEGLISGGAYFRNFTVSGLSLLVLYCAPRGFASGIPVFPRVFGFPRVLRFSPLTKNLNLIREPLVCQLNYC